MPDSWEIVGGVKQTLPDIPVTPVLATQPLSDEGVRFDRIQAFATPFTTTAYDKRLCDVSRHFKYKTAMRGGAWWPQIGFLPAARLVRRVVKR